MASERDTVYHACRVWGYIGEDEAPERCPVFGAIKEKFISVTAMAGQTQKRSLHGSM